MVTAVPCDTNVARRNSGAAEKMPYFVQTDFGVQVLGVAFDRDQLDTFWRPFFLAPKVTQEILAQRPDPLVVSEPSSKRLPDVFTWMNTWIVREGVKDIVEELEPGLHYFLPIEVVTEKTRTHLGTFYLMRVQQVVDAIVVEGTDYQRGKGRKGFAINNIIDLLGTAALDPARIGKGHLWREHAGFGSSTFCSDELYERITAAGVRGWRFKICRLGTAKDFEGYGE